jgi:hippurate hydrolase
MYELGNICSQMIRWRHQIHKHPEIAYAEIETSKLVVKVLRELGLEVHENIAKTGVVGVLKSGHSSKSIALRADMDALDIQELNDIPHASLIDGKMHACGHDGHTAMLLGAATYLTKNRTFDGTINFIFQPAEERGAGAKRMVDEGLFERFPADAVYGMHNYPLLPAGTFSICPGPMMAAFAVFKCHIKGRGTHSSVPETGIDPIPVAFKIHKAWQEFSISEFSAEERVNLSVTQVHSGSSENILPEIATLSGSTRCFSNDVTERLRTQMALIAKAICKSTNPTCEFEYDVNSPVLINTEAESIFAAECAAKLVGEEKTDRVMKAALASEDFSFMLQVKQGAYIFIGSDNGKNGGCMLHNPHYDFNDEILELGANYWIKLAESYLS